MSKRCANRFAVVEQREYTLADLPYRLQAADNEPLLIELSKNAAHLVFVVLPRADPETRYLVGESKHRQVIATRDSKVTLPNDTDQELVAHLFFEQAHSRLFSHSLANPSKGLSVIIRRLKAHR